MLLSARRDSDPYYTVFKTVSSTCWDTSGGSACPDSNRDYTVFETVASTGWATSGYVFDCVSYSIIGFVSLSIVGGCCG